MRFEIKAGGAILILVGLAGLSVVVFALGLFAGYDMARNTAPEAPQAASVYPLPNPPASEAAQAPAKSPDQVASVPASPNPRLQKRPPRMPVSQLHLCRWIGRWIVRRSKSPS